MYYGERFNSISHLAGAALAASGAALLIVFAAHAGDPWKIVSASVYGAMLFLLYLTSTLYHSLRGAAKEVMQKLDHCAIYLLIAGTYTPFSLVSLRDGLGWWLFGTIWTLALIGIVQEVWFAKGSRVLSLVIYVGMGWLVLGAIFPLASALSWKGVAWLAAGGAAYTLGIVFYAMDERIPHGHGVWHLFVLGGSAFHYFAIFFHVI